MLQSDFGGDPITKQNLNKWRHGGYRDWQWKQSALEATQRLIDDTAELRQTHSAPLTDTLALGLVARYIVAANQLKADDWKRLRELCADLVELRKGDHSAERLHLERERLDLEQKQLTKLREEEFWEWANAHRDEICRGYQSPEKVMPQLVKRIFGDKPDAAESTPVKPPGCKSCQAPVYVEESKPVAPSQTSEIDQSSRPVRNA